MPLLGAGLGLAGLAVGATGCSSEAAKPLYSDQQVADAKTAVCDGYKKGMRSIRIVAKRQPASEADRLGVAVNSRTGLVAVSTYFNDKLEANPAAPADLKEKLSQLAQQYQEVAIAQLADETPEDYKTNLDTIDSSVAEIDKLCR